MRLSPRIHLVGVARIVGYIGLDDTRRLFRRRGLMKVSDILRVKGNTLYTATPDEPLSRAIETMAEKDIGSLVIMDHGELAGMLTFREVIIAIVKNGGSVGATLVRSAM